MIYPLLSIKKSFTYLIFIITVQTLFPSCKTELDVNAPYKETTVIYGLLNPQDSVHFIKINKTFLGKENAYVMAAERDSSEYNRPGAPRMTATVEEWKGGTIQQFWVLEDTVVKNKESGTFYFPEQTIYYFITDPSKQEELDAAAQYRLIVNINQGEKTVTAKTSVIDNFIVTGQINTPCPSGGGICIGFMSNFSNQIYNDKLEFKWTSVKNGKRYQLKMTFNYIEEYTDGTSPSLKSIDWIFQPSVQSNNTDGNQGLSVPINGEDFYKELKKQLEPLTDDKIKKREFVDLYFSLYVAADDLNTYLLANEPSTGIIQEKPEFTNIENGIGIFSSRVSSQSDAKRMSDESLKELTKGNYTQSLKFCATIGSQNWGTCP